MNSSNPLLRAFQKLRPPKPKDRLDEFGHETLDPTPIAPPVGFRPAPSLAEQIREMVRSERLAREVIEAGYETFEEADDFDVGDDVDVSSPYEEHFEPTPAALLRERMAAEAAGGSGGSNPPPSAPSEPATPAPSPAPSAPPAQDPPTSTT